jgi:NADPH-dependent 2,4-dienoyl-CoA reductase/sulfur reductase-like enzyme
MESFDLLIVGGGAAGMAAAIAAAGAGRKTLLADRENELGGILNQCLHAGFGRHIFGEDLTGAEYGRRYAEAVRRSDVQVWTGAEVLSLGADRTALISCRDGLRRIGFARCILAAGCRETPLGALNVAGTRPAGIFTAGTAQKLVNAGHYAVGSEIVILGSGDVGQIMARQFVQAGKRVVAMVEQASELGGLARNRRECVEAYHIPVLLRTTVDEVLGAGRVSGVMLRDLDTGARRALACDTLVTAVGLVPDRALCRSLLDSSGALPDWLRLSGNCDYVHDIVDSVTAEALALGRAI